MKNHYLCLLTFLSILFTTSTLQAAQISEWKSSTGATIQLIGTEKNRFKVHVIGSNGSSLTGYGSWINSPDTFTYQFNDGKAAFYGKFAKGGWAIRVEGRHKVYNWKFVRWVSKK